MAQRPFFVPGDGIDTLYGEYPCEFTFYAGFALTQKRKSIASLHENILRRHPDLRLLEVSRRSEHELGISLSAFNLELKLPDLPLRPVENLFQASKVFAQGGPYLDLLHCQPGEAKNDPRLKNSGDLIEFRLGNLCYGLMPRSCFYDFLYLTALMQNPQVGDQLMKYDAFTDIEFNPSRSFSCQARSVAIYVSLRKSGKLESSLSNLETFSSVCVKNVLSFELC